MFQCFHYCLSRIFSCDVYNVIKDILSLEQNYCVHNEGLYRQLRGRLSYYIKVSWNIIHNWKFLSLMPICMSVWYPFKLNWFWLQYYHFQILTKRCYLVTYITYKLICRRWKLFYFFVVFISAFIHHSKIPT